MGFSLLQKLKGAEKRAVDRAARLVEKGKLDQAADALQAGLARAPQSLPLQLEFVRVLLLANRQSEAAESVRSLLRSQPSAEAAVRELADLCRFQGLPAGHVHHVLAEHSLRRGEISLCMEHLERIDRMDRSALAREHLQRFQGGIERDQTPLPRGVAVSGMYVALVHEASGEDGPALDIYEALLRADPKLFGKLRQRLEGISARNYRNVGFRIRVMELYMAHGDAVRATKEAELLLEACPGAVSTVAGLLSKWLGSGLEQDEVRLALARARWVEGRRREALEDLEPLVARGERDAELEPLLSRWRMECPDALQAAVLLAEILARRGQAGRAVQTVAEVADRVPPETMQPTLERLVQQHAGQPRAHLLLARLRQRQGDLKGALEALSTLRQQVPGGRGEGTTILREIVRREPHNETAQTMLVEDLLEAGQLDPAVTLLRHRIHREPQAATELVDPLEKLAASNPGHPAARLAAAEAWISVGDPERAVPHLGAAMEHPGRAGEVAHRISLVLERWPDRAGPTSFLVEALAGKLADPAAHPYLRAQLEAAQGRPEAATDLLGQCYGTEPRRTAPAVAALLQRLVASHDRSSPPRMLLAQILADQGDPLGAVSIVAEAPEPEPGLVSLLLDRLEAMVAERPGDPDLPSGLARLLLFAGRPEEAVEVAERALSSAGDGAGGSLHLARGEALLAMGKRREALLDLGRAAEVQPDFADQVVSRLEGLRASAPGDPEVPLVLAPLLGRTGRIDEGLALLVGVADRWPERIDKAVDGARAIAGLQPSDPRPLLTAARIQASAGRLADAASLALEALECGVPAASVDELVSDLLRGHPEHPDLLRCLGLARAPGQPGEACRLLERTAREGGEHIELALEGLHRVAALHPDREEPLVAAARLLLIRGDAPAAYRALGPALGEGDPSPEALEVLAPISEILREEPGPSLALARGHIARSRPDEALGAVDRALEAGADPGELEPFIRALLEQGDPSPALRLLRARVRAAQGKVDDAIADLEQAVRQGLGKEALKTVSSLLADHPDHPEARKLQAGLLVEGGSPAEARSALDAALGVAGDGPDRMGLLLDRAELLRRSGDAAAASEDLRQAESLAHDRDAFLEEVHLRRRRRLASQLVESRGARRVRLLLELGRWDEAGRALSEESLSEDESRFLRASALLARGDPAGCVRLIRTAPSGPLLVDAGQRCDRPELALAAVDRMLEGGENEELLRVRRRLIREIWRRDQCREDLALVARIPFQPRSRDL